MNEAQLRTHLRRLLDWQDAHVNFDAAIADIPPDRRGERPPGIPHSPWELLEHLRRAQHDILEFCINPEYEELKWPADYWPPPASSPTDDEWRHSIADYKKDRVALDRLAAETDLFRAIPHGQGQTYLRELLLVADHTAYHVGQLVLVRRLLGLWPES